MLLLIIFPELTIPIFVEIGILTLLNKLPVNQGGDIMLNNKKIIPLLYEVERFERFLMCIEKV